MRRHQSFPRLSPLRFNPTMSFVALLIAVGGILASFSTSRGSPKAIPARHVKSLAHDLCLVASGIR